MQKITPSLWFDDNAEKAMNFYVSNFKNAEVLNVSRYGESGPGPEDSVLVVNFRLAGLEFIALNGGPHFTPTPAVSFFVGCETAQELDDLWASLSEGGSVLMELGEYPFSEKYGWVQDRFEFSWQLILTGEPQSIAPALMFVGDHHGRAEEAMRLYTTVFENASIGHVERYGAGQLLSEGSVMHATFTLVDQPFMAMDSGLDHDFTFNEAISFTIDCKSQEEVDYFWVKLIEGGGEPSQCGWLKDKFGLSWQVVPTILIELMRDEDPVKANRVMQAMLQMSKIDIAKLQGAYNQQ